MLSSQLLLSSFWIWGMFEEFVNILKFLFCCDFFSGFEQIFNFVSNFMFMFAFFLKKSFNG